MTQKIYKKSILTHKNNIRIYYEDTDAGGVVYYANYLKFFERARTDAISNIGLSNKKLLDEYGVFIIVKSCNVEYLKPAKLEDQLEIKSSIISTSNTSFKMKQKAFRDLFDKILKKHGVDSPNDLEDSKKDDFFNEVEREWKKDPANTPEKGE